MRNSGKRAVFRYSKTAFILRSAFAAVVMLFAVFLFRNPSPEIIPWFALLMALLAGFLAVYGISPMLTSHWLTRSRLILRYGIYFKCIIPLRDIESVGPYDAAMRIGLSLSWRSSILFVTSSMSEMIEVRLKNPRRFWQVFGLGASRIVFNVDNRGEMLSLMAERMASLTPIKADGSDAQLGD